MSFPRNRKRRRTATILEQSHAKQTTSPPNPVIARTLFTLFDRSEFYPIFEHLTKLLNIKDIISLCRTCRKLSTLVDDLKLSQWNINKKLSRFVKDPPKLRSLLGQSDALIFGDFALHFFERVAWPDEDLSILVKEGAGSSLLADHLLEVEGYSWESTDDWDLTYSTKCHTYHRGESKIKLFITWSIPIWAVLNYSYATAIVSVITWNKAYSIFPQPTFINYEMYPLTKLNDHYGNLFAKHSVRGWRLKIGPSYGNVCALRTLEGRFYGSDGPAQGRRRVGDKHTWKMSLDTTSVSAGSTPDSVIEFASFAINSSTLGYFITADVLSSNVLRYSYTFYDTGFEQIENILSNSVWMQMHKIKPEDRPEGFQTMPPAKEFTEDSLKLKKPIGWDYFDDEIPGMFAYWARRGPRRW